MAAKLRGVLRGVLYYLNYEDGSGGGADLCALGRLDFSVDCQSGHIVTIGL